MHILLLNFTQIFVGLSFLFTEIILPNQTKCVHTLHWQDFAFFWPPTPLCLHFLPQERWQEVLFVKVKVQIFLVWYTLVQLNEYETAPYFIQLCQSIGLFTDFCVVTCFYQFLHNVIIKLFCRSKQNNFMSTTSCKNW